MVRKAQRSSARQQQCTTTSSEVFVMAYEPRRGDSSSSTGTVAFTAKLNISDSYPKHCGVLKFATLLVNEGGGYSPDTGVFTCPMDGFYHFTVHVSVYGRGQCGIHKNGEKVVSLYHTTLPDKCSQVASMSSVIKLSKYDEVCVQLWGPDRNDIFATEDNDTVFAGVRLG
ncbi:complement C1q and tumor necrosis factor-related protein 9-like isoform X1 [Epinephelus moara]|uniref:complement C1q and tumor necrosis factor-related protein 9-like isoform X1 n=2 Tax=Epinephelus moara TaxID=300413 RepID=UPI00214DFF13|nr:complement C1q and tumor necrosis factor-related protein 9-like isoform X1 [Epinephelus moara]